MKKVITHDSMTECLDDMALVIATEKVSNLVSNNEPDEVCWSSVVDASTNTLEYYLFWDGDGLTTYDVVNQSSDHIILFHF